MASSELVSLEAIRRLLTPYHIGHTALVLAYWPVRSLWPGDRAALQAPSTWWDALTREQEILLLMAFVIFVKARRVVTLEDLWEKALLFSRCGVAALLCFISKYAFMWYTVFLLALFLALRPPKFAGDEEMEYFNPVSFESKVRSPQGADRKVLWLVIFHADWCEKCTVMEPLFGKLSCRFTSERRRFAKVDLELYSELATEFSIDVSGFTKQLPTVIMFYKGRELRRLPTLGKGGKPIASNLSEAELVQWFELEKDVHTVLHPKEAERKSAEERAQAKKAKGKAKSS